MTDSNRDEPGNGVLNPALKQSTETTYDTTNVTPAPIDTASAKEGEGEGWPLIWLAIVAICVLVTVYILFG